MSASPGFCLPPRLVHQGGSTLHVPWGVVSTGGLPFPAGLIQNLSKDSYSAISSSLRVFQNAPGGQR